LFVLSAGGYSSAIDMVLTATNTSTVDVPWTLAGYSNLPHASPTDLQSTLTYVKRQLALDQSPTIGQANLFVYVNKNVKADDNIPSDICGSSAPIILAVPSAKALSTRYNEVANALWSANCTQAGWTQAPTANGLCGDGVIDTDFGETCDPLHPNEKGCCSPLTCTYTTGTTCGSGGTCSANGQCSTTTKKLSTPEVSSSTGEDGNFKITIKGEDDDCAFFYSLGDIGYQPVSNPFTIPTTDLAFASTESSTQLKIQAYSQGSKVSPIGTITLKDPGTSKRAGIIAGFVIGVLLFIGICIGGYWYWKRRKRAAALLASQQQYDNNPARYMRNLDVDTYYSERWTQYTTGDIVEEPRRSYYPRDSSTKAFDPNKQYL